MFRNIKLVFILSIVSASTIIVTSGCKKTTIVDLSNITAPVPEVEDTIESGAVFIQWSPLNGASKYRLEIASPSFSNSPDFIFDTIITGLSCSLNLDINRYEARLTGINDNSVSKTSRSKAFWVGPPIIGTGGPVVLETPEDFSAVNETFDGVFNWEPLAGADSYVFEIQGYSTLFYADDITGTSIDINDVQLPMGIYYWQVRAITGSSSTSYTRHLLYVDDQDPEMGEPWYPVNGAVTPTGMINFQWGYPSEQGIYQTPRHTILQISTSTDFGTLVYNSVVDGNSINLSLPPGNYYWRVQISDQAGNLAPISEVFSLQVTP